MIEKIKELWEGLKALPLAELKIEHILFLAVILVVAYIVLKYVFKGLKIILVGTYRVCKKATPKSRCSRIQCKTCGRSLANCTCIKNKNRGYASRIRLYNREQRLAKKQIKK